MRSDRRYQKDSWHATINVFLRASIKTLSASPSPKPVSRCPTRQLKRGFASLKVHWTCTFTLSLHFNMALEDSRRPRATHRDCRHWQGTQFHHLLSPCVSYTLFGRQGGWTWLSPLLKPLSQLSAHPKLPYPQVSKIITFMRPTTTHPSDKAQHPAPPTDPHPLPC